MKFRISEKYRLEIYWGKVVYEQEGIAKLEECYLSGPALKEVEEINQKDHIDLDFTKQYIVFVPSYYVARLSWNGAKQASNRIYLKDVSLENKHINSVPNLNHDDFIVIDTKDHEDERHEHHLTYSSYLIKSDGDLYKFRR